jgi:hypothetical protein
MTDARGQVMTGARNPDRHRWARRHVEGVVLIRGG